MNILSFLGNLAINFFARLFKDWRRDEELKEAGAIEQRNKNMEAREEARKSSDADFKKVDETDVDLRNDL